MSDCCWPTARRERLGLKEGVSEWTPISELINHHSCCKLGGARNDDGLRY
jgi:hypothetical protein